MYSDLKDKVALITGAGKRTGIGYAMAEKLASCGAHVVITDVGRDIAPEGQVKTGTHEEMAQLASELAESHGVKTLSIELDVTDGFSVQAMIDTLFSDRSKKIAGRNEIQNEKRFEPL